MHMCRNSTCSWIVAWRTYRRRFLAFCSVVAHSRWNFPPTPFSPSFTCFNSVTGACSFYCVGVLRICQPWEQSSSRSWLSIVEAPGCLRHPTSILVMQLLSYIFFTYLPAFQYFNAVLNYIAIKIICQCYCKSSHEQLCEFIL